MKYTKKVPYFKKGDKIDKAARNLPKKQKEAVLKVSSAQKEQERKDKLSSVGANFKKPTATAKVEGPKTSQASKIKPVEKKPEKPAAKTRDEAFAQARKANKKEFIWEGNPYHTRTAEEMAAERKAEEEAKRKANAGKTSKDKTSKDKTSAEVEQPTPSTVNSGSTTSSENPETAQQNRTNTYIENNKYTGPRYYRREFTTDNTGAQVPTYFSGRDPENLKRIRNYALVNKGPYFQAQKIFDKIDRGELKRKGGTINKFQRGNVLTNREQHLVDVSRLPKLSIPQVWSRKLFGTGPKPVETGRTHLNKAGEQVPEVGNRIIMPGGRDNTTITRGTNYGSGWLTSQRNIQKGDTTYLTPGGNAPSAADLPRYKSVFDNADKAIWKSRGYQQGGAIQQQGVDKEALVADFVVRYLKTMGVPEEAIVTPEGTVNPEYEKELTAVITEIDSPEFWLAYQSSPDEVVTQVVRERNPNAVTMAKKGAKLKRLSQLRIYKK